MGDNKLLFQSQNQIHANFFKLKQEIFNQTNEVTPLTSFRFIVVLVIFLFHCAINSNFGVVLDIKLIDKFLQNGAVFMTGFFVLSEYIMAFVYHNKHFENVKEIGNFYKKRFAKIYPAYFLGTVVYFVTIKPIAFSPEEIR